MSTADTVHPQYHIEFEKKDGTLIGLKLCDAAGKVHPLNINQQDTPTLSLKMYQGGTKHSDYEPPYEVTEQRSMSGGRGLKDHEDDKTRFLEAWNMDTSNPGHVFLGPRARYTLGPRTGTQWVPGSLEWLQLTGDTRAIDIPFTPDAGYDAKEIWLWLRYTGEPEDLQIDHYTDSGGDPDASQESTTVSYTEADDLLGIEVKITMPTATTVSADTKYHIVVNASVEDDSENYWEIGYNRRAAREVQYTDTGGWNSSTWGVYYRVMEAAKEGRPHFFRYKNGWYMGYSYDEGLDPFTSDNPSKVFINGEQGIVSGGNKYAIEDDTKSWATDEHKGSILMIVRGTPSSYDPRWAKIESNDGTTLVLESPLAASFNADEQDIIYVIIGSDRWTEITGHGIRGAISDVLSTHSIAYFALGDDERAVRMRRYVGGAAQDTWTDEWTREDFRATFLEVGPDSNGDIKIWMANHEVPSKVWRADPVRGTGSSTVNNLNTDRNNLVAESSFETVASWSDVGTPTTSERSTDIVFGGSYSYKVVTDGADEGIQQDITTEADQRCIAVCVVHADTVPENGNIEFYCDGNLIRQTPNSYQAGGTEWAYFKGVFVASGTTTTVKVTATAGGTTFYIDEVEVWQMPTPVDMTGEERITNIGMYDDPEVLHVLTDGGLYFENNGYFRRIPLDEFSAVRDDRNGRVSLVHDVYLYFSLLDGLERYINGTIDDMGINRDEGLPENRRGEYSFLAGYPPRFYAGIDAGDDGYSSVVVYNGRGWHDLHIAPLGERIRGGKVQAIPGDEPDRLWFGQGSDVMWVPMVLNPVDRLE